MRALGMHRTQHCGGGHEYWPSGHSPPHLFKKSKDAPTREGTVSPSPFHWSAKLVTYLTHLTGNPQAKGAETWGNKTHSVPDNESGPPTSPGTTGNL